MAEEEQDQEVGSGRGRFLLSMVGVLVMVVGIVVLAHYMDVLQSDELRAEFKTDLAAKADSTEVAREIARLDSAKANIADLDSARMSISTLTRVASTLNSRVVKAEENLDKNRRAAAAAAGSAKKARKLAQEVGDQLARLDAENKAWQASTAGTLAALPREIDSRVGPVAADLSAFQRVQAEGHAAQDSINAVHTVAVKAFRAKLRLSDKDMARLAAEMEKREQKEQKRRGK